MQNVMDMKRNKPDIISFIKQAGVSSLLFIVLVGLSLTVLTVGYMSTMRNLQSSATTTHAQTQAQMQAMIGYHAFSKYLNQLSKEDNGLRLIDQLCNGEIEESNPETQIKFERVGACNNPVLKDQYKFDIIGKSGGASAILRANYNITSELSKEQFKGSVFEGGLQVNKLESLIADGVTLEVGGGTISEMGGSGKTYSEAELIAAGIKVVPYQQRDFISPEEARKYANYIFYSQGGVNYCKRNNYYDANTSKKITSETDAEAVSSCAQGISKSTDKWIVNSSLELPVGVLWFDGDVEVQIHNSEVVVEENNSGTKTNVTTNNPKNILVNTIISTKHINSTIIELNGNYVATYYKAYAPHHYVLNAASEADKTERLKKICPTNYPTQYCESAGVLKSFAEMEKMPASISNLLYLSRTLQLSGGKDQKNVHVNYYGNLIANSTAAGTGSSSGKLVGTGTVRIEGNLMVVGGTDMTEMTGDFKLNLSKADDPGNFVPVHKKIFTVGGMRYM
ncbi:hypothetical protein [Acinetobacter indicus]|uniref:hypothetical protein n=1 Tax=Acinetobacter indicus TaxID=756892 RepID=UPI001444480D|nr:hypothetical protein [Acinetobacter indicus]